MNDDKERIVRALRANDPGAKLSERCLRSALADLVSQPRGLSRASLVLAGASRMGMEPTTAEKIACAIEYWHQASLVFDDLPCMDDSLQRRGRSSLHVVHGEAVAILSALGLVNRAYALVDDAYQTESQDTRASARELIEAALGARGILEGQALDLRPGPGANAPREVLRTAWRKTGFLIWLSLCLPLVPSGAWKRSRRDLRAIGIYWSLVYQGLDDLADASHDQKSSLGPTRADPIHRPNLAISLGAERALERIERLLRAAQITLERMSERDPRFSYLMDWHHRHLVARYSELVAA